MYVNYSNCKYFSKVYPTRQSARDHGVNLVQSVDGDVGAQMVGRSVGRPVGRLVGRSAGGAGGRRVAQHGMAWPTVAQPFPKSTTG